MTLIELNNQANEMIKHFVNCLGLDGDYYIQTQNESPIICAKLPNIYKNAKGKFLTPETQELAFFLSQKNYSKDLNIQYSHEGLIVINGKINTIPIDKKNEAYLEVMDTIIHEKYHANRTLLVNTQYDENQITDGIIYDKNKYVQNTQNNTPHHIDASQDVMHCQVDNSLKTIQCYSQKTPQQIEKIFAKYPQTNAKIRQQIKIDEALVDLMSMISLISYLNNNNNIMSIIKRINQHEDRDDLIAISSIILRHNDLELFKWMLDPLSYQLDNINYDFFWNYLTEEDMFDLELITYYIDDIESNDIDYSCLPFTKRKKK